jgi:sugar lactone lactonase YvrE
MYNTSSDTVEKLDIEFFAPAYKDEFFVHGISVVRETDGLFLYSVNHSPDASGDSVYVFKFNPKRRQLFQTGKFRHELMSSMNDVVAIGKGQFYATNDMWQSHGSALGLAESFLRLPVTSAISCNLFNQTCTRAAKWIRSGNGIAYHKSTNRVLISGCLDLQIHVYKRLEDNSLEYEYSIPLGSAPDNIHVDERGVVWIAVHLKSSYPIFCSCRTFWSRKN